MCFFLLVCTGSGGAFSCACGTCDCLAVRFFRLSGLLPFAFYLLPFTFYLLPFAFCLLPFAFCLLPSAFCLLSFAFCECTV
jgi:hypothetical protein